MLAAFSDVASVTVTDADHERVAKVATDLRVEPAAGVEELLVAVDAVVIAAATSSPAPQLIKSALERGLPTFCEKPIALDLDASVEIVELAHETAVPLQMGFQRRFDEGYRAAHELVASGGLGDLYIVRMAGHDPSPPHEDYIKSSGGIFRDFSIHDFDALRFVTGDEVGEVYADGSATNFSDLRVSRRRRHRSGGPQVEKRGFRHPVSWHASRPPGLRRSHGIIWVPATAPRLAGTSAPLCARSSPACPAPPPDAYPNFQERFKDAYRRELSAFIEVASGATSSPCTAEDALEDAGGCGLRPLPRAAPPRETRGVAVRNTLDRVAATPRSPGVFARWRDGTRLPTRRGYFLRSRSSASTPSSWAPRLSPGRSRIAASVTRLSRPQAGWWLCTCRPAQRHSSRDRVDGRGRGGRLAWIASAEVLVVAAASAHTGYEVSEQLDTRAWVTLAHGIEHVEEVADSRGLRVALHPHYGTTMEEASDIERVLDSSSAALCIDTGHLTVAGADPLEVVNSVLGRIAHVHLKDVDVGLSRLVGSGALGYQEAVRRRGMYRPLGSGDVRTSNR